MTDYLDHGLEAGTVMIETSVVSILLDIKEQNGAMGAQLIAAGHHRQRLEDQLKEMGQKIDMVDHRTDIIEVRQSEVAKGVDTLTRDLAENVKPDVAKLKLLAGKFTAFWGTGIAVIIWAFSYFSAEIHSLASSIFGKHS